MTATVKTNHSDVTSGIAPVVQRMAAGVHDAVDRAADAATAAARMVDKKGGKLLKTVQDQQARYVDSCRESVRENPLAAVGVAIAAGVVLSFLLIRR